jgi:hypothetical protein
MLPHGRSVLLATDGQGHNNNGQGLLVLPAQQSSQTRPPTASRDTGSSLPLRPHLRQPGRSAATLPQPYLPVHNNRQNLEVAGGQSPLVHHRHRLCQGPLRRLGIPVWSSRHHHIGQRGPIHVGLCSLLNIQLSPTTAYRPQSNRLVERFHRRLKDALRSRAAAADWHDHLPWVMLASEPHSGMTARFHQRRPFSAHN